MTINWNYNKSFYTHKATIGDYVCEGTEEPALPFTEWVVEFQGEPIARGTAKDWKLARALMEAVVEASVTATYGI